MDALDHAERRVGALELLAQDREADVVHPGTAVVLGNRSAEEAELAHPAEQLAREAAFLVPAPDVRQDLRLREGAGALLDEAVLIREGEIDHPRMLAAGPSLGAPEPILD